MVKKEKKVKEVKETKKKGMNLPNKITIFRMAVVIVIIILSLQTVSSYSTTILLESNIKVSYGIDKATNNTITTKRKLK